METKALPWAQFKALVDAWQIKPNIRWLVDANGWVNAWVRFEGKIVEVASGFEPGSPELAEFEAGYQPYPGGTWVPGKDVNRSDDSAAFMIAPNGVTVFDFPIPDNTFIWGGEFEIGGAVPIENDELKVEVIDAAGMFAPPGTALRAPIRRRIMEGRRSIDIGSPDGSPSFLPAGVVLRFSFTETNGVAKTGVVNLVLMK